MLLPNIFGENLFDDWMNFSFPDIDKALYGKQAQHVMKTADGYEFDIDLPGYKKDEVNVQFNNGYLAIQAAKGEEKEQKDPDGQYIRRERYSGSMSRSFFVGKDIKKEEIHAKFEDGILKLSVPKKDKKEIEESQYIAIEG